MPHAYRTARLLSRGEQCEINSMIEPTTTPTLVPKRIEPRNATEILLAWNNGDEYALPYFELRFHCPCASCVDEHTGKRTLKREQIQPDVRPLSIHPIGRYAIQINWSDRHSTGMYSFEGLATLCQALGVLLKTQSSSVTH